jgi:hypothetical protein
MPTADEFKQYNRPLIEEFRANAGKVKGINHADPAGSPHIHVRHHSVTIGR